MFEVEQHTIHTAIHVGQSDGFIFINRRHREISLNGRKIWIYHLQPGWEVLREFHLVGIVYCVHLVFKKHVIADGEGFIGTAYPFRISQVRDLSRKIQTQPSFCRTNRF